MKKNVNMSDYQQLPPSGICRMGKTDVTYYRTNGGRVWFDKLQIEYVLTGKNQHNLLGQYKDHRNHSTIFDTDKNVLVDVISKTGVSNYLKKAWSVKDENRHDFYSGVKSIEQPKDEKVSEPLQMPIFETGISVSVKPFVKISEDDGKYNVDYRVSGKDEAEKRMNIASLLISAANSIMTGNTAMVKLKEVA